VIVLDTDALGHLQKKDPVGRQIEARLDAALDRDVRITAITAYEMVGGAVALVDRRKRARRDLVPALHLLRDLVEYLGLWRGLIPRVAKFP
jgi:predicted nucleic acid-binding protein